VLGDGTPVAFGRRAHGLDLVPLLVGSEGTLGVFTELELRLHAAPAERAFVAFELPTTSAGIGLLRRIYQAGLRPAVARLYDPLDTLLFGRHAHEHAPSTSLEPWDRDKHRGLARWLGFPRAIALGIAAAERTFMRKTLLILVFEGETNDARADARAATALADEAGARPLGDGPARAWYARRYAVSYDQSLVFRQGAFSDTLEVAAPWSQLEEVYDAVRRAIGRYALVMAHLSHAYPDGCSIYFTFVARSDADADAVHRAIWRDAMNAVIDAGGSISHHHGIGRLRAEALGHELGVAGLELLARVKRAWDPDGVLSPGSPIGAAPSAEALAAARSEAGAARATAWHVDPESGLADAPGDMRLAHVERALNAEGRTLGLTAAPPDLDVSAWIAAGQPGLRDPLEDPVEQRLAGFGARTAELRYELAPAPRRATGPDLSALWLGAEARVGAVEHAWLRAHSLRRELKRKLPYRADRAPAVTASERQAWDAVVRRVNGS
jgi:alkyldihydroxyacetonephosphate synthase